MQQGLIISKFDLDGGASSVIIDTGATASFVPQLGALMRVKADGVLTTGRRVKVANDTIVDLSSMVSLRTKPTNSDYEELIWMFYVMPKRRDLMGHDAIIGLDLIKKLGISVSPIDGIMTAKIGSRTIGKESLLSLAAITCDKQKHMEVDKSENKQLNTLLHSYSDVFAEAAEGAILTEPMSIPLTTNKPIKVKLRRNSIEDKIEMHKQITTLINNGIIEKSTSEYSCNARLVPKKNGKSRLVVNFIPLNAIAKKDNYPMPQLSDLFHALRGAKYFAAMDCTEGFFQIEVLPEHRERTAFITDFGSFQFKRCPFGFTNSPAKFQRTMNGIFEEGLYTRCVIYVDDILVFGRTEEELLCNLKWALDKCRNYRVKLKKSKCEFLKSSVVFLGHQISFNSIAPVPGKNDHLVQGNPENKTDVLSILGSLNHYSRFITDFPEKTREIRKLTKDGTDFKWTTEHQEQLKSLVAELETAKPQLIPDVYEPKILEVYIRHTSVETACLNQDGQLISRVGNVLSTSQYNYTPVEKTLLGLVYAYSKFSPFLKGEVTVKTTCKGLKPAIQARTRPERVERLLLLLPPDVTFNVETINTDPQEELMKDSDQPPDEVFYTDGACNGNGKPHCKASWAVLATQDRSLSASGLVEHHKPSNQVAEVTAAIKAMEIAKKNNLKRIVIITDSKYVSEPMNGRLESWMANGWKDHKNKPLNNEKILRQLESTRNGLEIQCFHVKGHGTDVNNIEVDRMAKEVIESSLAKCGSIASQPEIIQDGDEEIQQILSRLTDDERLASKYRLIEGRLYYFDHRQSAEGRNRLFVPSKYRKLMMELAHDDPIWGGHLGFRKTKQKLFKYFWPKMNGDIEGHIRSCAVCQEYKVPKGPLPGLLQPLPISYLFDRLHIDIVGPMQASMEGSRYIITAIDAFSRYAYARAAKSVSAIDIIRFLEEEVISRHGVPNKIVSDNGPQFISENLKIYVKKLGIQHSRTTDYHPQANGMDERFNGTLVKILRCYIAADQKNWDTRLMWALTTYNTTINDSTKFSPFNIVYGTEPRTPLTEEIRTSEDEEEAWNLTNSQPLHKEVREAARSNMEEAQQRQKSSYDKNSRPQDFNLFDMVMVKVKRGADGMSKKFSGQYYGPCMITRIIQHNEQPQAVEILDPTRFKLKRIPFQLLKHYDSRDEPNRGLDGKHLPGAVVIDASRDQDQLDSEPEAYDPPSPSLEAPVEVELSGQGVSTPQTPSRRPVNPTLLHTINEFPTPAKRLRRGCDSPGAEPGTSTPVMDGARVPHDVRGIGNMIEADLDESIMPSSITEHTNPDPSSATSDIAEAISNPNTETDCASNDPHGSQPYVDAATGCGDQEAYQTENKELEQLEPPNRSECNSPPIKQNEHIPPGNPVRSNQRLRRPPRRFSP